MGKNAKVEDYAGFWAFCRKKHEIFTNPVFKNPGINKIQKKQMLVQHGISATKSILLNLKSQKIFQHDFRAEELNAKLLPQGRGIQ